MSSTTRTLTYGELERFLTQIGFIAEQAQPGYRLFRHERPEVLIVLPSRQAGDTVDTAHMVAVRTHILENGLLNAASFERLLWGPEPTVASQ